MKIHVHFIILLISVILTIVIFNITESVAQDDTISRLSLMRIDTLSTVFVNVSEHLTEYVQEERLRTIIELELRKVGFSIVNHHGPFLVLNLTAVPIRSYDGEITNYAVTIDFELQQGVRLIRDLTISSVASTWGSTYTANMGKNKVRQVTEEITRNVVEDFLNAYLAVNPKR